MKRMDDKEQLLLLYTIILSVLLVVVTIVFTDRINRLEDRLDQLEKNTTVTVIESPDLHTLTDAILSEPEISTHDTLEGSEKAFKVEEVELSTEEIKDDSRASESVQRVYLGEYELTAYEWTGEVCADGNYPSCGYTVGCNNLELGTRIYIEGYGEYVVEDRGGMPDNVIDIYMEDYDTCINFGRRTADVYIID